MKKIVTIFLSTCMLLSIVIGLASCNKEHYCSYGEMTYDDNYHWFECLECGKPDQQSPHTFSKNDNICDSCGYNKQGGEEFTSEIVDGISYTKNYSYYDEITNNSYVGVEVAILDDSATIVEIPEYYKGYPIISVTIDHGVTKELSIPSSVRKIISYDASALEKITVSEDNSVYSSVDGILYNKDKTQLLLVPSKISGEVSFPDSLTQICNVYGEPASDLALSYITKLETGDGIQELPEAISAIALKELHIGKSLQNVDIDLLAGLEKITVDSENPAYYEENGILYDKAKTYVILVPNGVRKAEFSDGVQEISIMAGARNMLQMVVPKSVKTIDINFNVATKLQEIYNLSSVNLSSYANYLDIHTSKDEASVLLEQNGYTFYQAYYDDGTVEFTELLDYNGAEKNITLPETYNGDFYRIADNAFAYHPTVEQVKIPSTVISIGQEAFAYCNSLKKATIACDVDAFAFRNCENLQEIVWAEGVSSIENDVFLWCQKLTIMNAFPSSLQSIYAANSLPDGVKETVNGVVYFKNWALGYIEGTTNVTIREGTVGLSTYFFTNSETLMSLSVPVSVRILPYEAYSLPSTLYELQDNGLYLGSWLMGVEDESQSSLIVRDGTTNALVTTYLEELSIPATLKNIQFGYEPEKLIFRGDLVDWLQTSLFGYTGWQVIVDGQLLSEITSLTLPVGITEIPSDGLKDFSNLQTLVLPEGVTTIAAHAIDAGSLKELYLPTTLTEVSFGAFDNVGDTELKIYYSGTLENFLKMNFVGETGARALPYAELYVNDMRVTEITLPDTAVNVETYMYKGITLIISADNPKYLQHSGVIYDKTSMSIAYVPQDLSGEIVIPEGVTVIGYMAFKDRNITKVTLPSTLKTIDSYAFYGTDISELYIPASVTEIGEFVFAETHLKNVVIPKTVEIIGINSFLSETIEKIYYEGTFDEWIDITNDSSVGCMAYFYSEEEQTIENYLETEQTYWYFDAKGQPAFWLNLGNSLNGKTYVVTDAEVTVSDYYWSLIVLLKENDMLDQAFATDTELYAVANAATTKQEYEQGLAEIYGKQYGEVSFSNGMMTVSNPNVSGVTVDYIEVNGMVYVEGQGFVSYISSDTQIYEITVGEKIDGNDTISVKYIYTVVSN